MSRIFKPKPGELLYHYCSTQTMMAMLHSRTLRFSDINMMNDAQESRWGYSLFEEAATQLLSRKDLPSDVPSIPEEFFGKVDEVVHQIQLIAHPFISCFSRDPDSLEQWRAYGDDGRGIALGFSAESLSRLPCTMFEVLYDPELQVREVRNLLLELFKEFSALVPDDSDKEFRNSCAELGILFSAFKHPAFKAEREVRLVHAMSLEKTLNGGRRFVDSGGERNGVTFAGRPVGFYVRDGHLTAHIDMPMDVNGTSPLECVLIGPKNPTGDGNLLLYLANEGFDQLRFGHSQVPYR